MATDTKIAERKGLVRYMPSELQWIYEALLLRQSTNGTALSLGKALRNAPKAAVTWPVAFVHGIMYGSSPPAEGASSEWDSFPLHIKIYLFLFRLALWPYRLIVRTARRLQRNVRRVLRICMIARDEVTVVRKGLLSQLALAPGGTIQSVPGRVMYLVYNSLPFHSAGYATRSQGLVGGIRALGYDSTIVTRLGYPHVFSKFRDTQTRTFEQIETVPYLRLNSALEELFVTSTKEYVKLNAAATLRAAAELRPAIVHGASNFITGLTAVSVGRVLGVPSIYEVRGLWEVTALSRDPSYAETLRYAHALRLETEACMEADRVITITNALKEELVRRGVPSEKIDVVPNGVDTDRFRPRPRDAALGEKLGLKPDHVVVGYVGSILDYEGLDDLLHAIRLCVDRGLSNLRALIVGDGAAYQDCLELARKLRLDEHVIFTGRVPHAEVESYYSLIDVTPFPRKPLPVCEMVSPLKPFEAMAMGKCVIVSSVAALAEIIGERPIGFISEKGSIEALAQVIAHVAGDGELRRTIGEEARRFVVAERDWRILARRVTEVYEKLSVPSAG